MRFHEIFTSFQESFLRSSTDIEPFECAIYTMEIDEMPRLYATLFLEVPPRAVQQVESVVLTLTRYCIFLEGAYDRTLDLNLRISLIQCLSQLILLHRLYVRRLVQSLVNNQTGSLKLLEQYAYKKRLITLFNETKVDEIKQLIMRFYNIFSHEVSDRSDCASYYMLELNLQVAMQQLSSYDKEKNELRDHIENITVHETATTVSHTFKVGYNFGKALYGLIHAAVGAMGVASVVGAAPALPVLEKGVDKLAEATSEFYTDMIAICTKSKTLNNAFDAFSKLFRLKNALFNLDQLMEELHLPHDKELAELKRVIEQLGSYQAGAGTRHESSVALNAESVKLLYFIVVQALLILQYYYKQNFSEAKKNLVTSIFTTSLCSDFIKGKGGPKEIHDWFLPRFQTVKKWIETPTEVRNMTYRFFNSKQQEPGDSESLPKKLKDAQEAVLSRLQKAQAFCPELPNVTEAEPARPMRK